MLDIDVIDAFTAEPFSGNPAAVCLLPGSRSDGWMQRVAMEMNLSETAFLQAAGEGTHALRWFTPAVEVDLCGHATLASAHFLWERGLLDATSPARFDTRSGRLTCRREDDRIYMDFPARPGTVRDAPDGLFDALGIDGGRVLENGMDLIVAVESGTMVRELAPDLRALSALPVRGVIVTAPGERGDVDFVSRFFAPAAGVDEDPVTGSAHCFSGPYWAQVLGRSELVAEQLSRRGGRLGVRVRGERVELSGQAVTTLRGRLLAH
ncbi:MAG: PhzF family phenazine biosynthesis protein [Myxococcales bacterium]|jgi:PhzF family phenazine biosynthesis protein